MKNLEDMIKEKLEEIVVLMEANSDSLKYGGTAYHLDDGTEINVSAEWRSSSYDC